VSESSDPTQRVVISESSTSSKTPHFPPVSGDGGATLATGTSSNIDLPASGGDAAATPPEVAKAAPPPEPATAQTKQDKKDYFAPVQTTQTVRTAPLLRRLSIALFLDESMGAAAEDLTASVKTAVGFDAARGDEISVTTIAFAAPEAAPAGAPEEAPSPLVSPLVETLLRRGVEIASALVFLFVLFRGIKGARALATRPAAAEEAPSPAVVEMLARAKVAELIEKEPAKVGRILSEWARDTELVGGAK
jgi:flagellar M-ring protein FliF